MDRYAAKRIEQISSLINAAERFATRRTNFVEALDMALLAPHERTRIISQTDDNALNLFELYAEGMHLSDPHQMAA